MKKLLLPALLAVFVALPASAQETNVPPSTTFFQSVTGYFSSFNTNLLTFQLDRASVWASVDWQSGVNVSASLGLEYRLGKSALSLESVTRNANIAGTIVGQQAGLGLNFTVHDVRLTGYVDGGYDFTKDKMFCEIGARAKKALTDHTFIGVGIGARIQKQSPAPVFSIFTGFTF
jgi:hypothetical protein